MKSVFFPATVIILAISVGLPGCTSSETVEPTTSNTPTMEGHAEHMNHAENAHAEHAQHSEAGLSAMDEMKAELAKLSPEDAASAENQHMCPVSGEMLGTMGAPQKVDVNGRQVWICCDGCKDKLLANPNEYLAKLQ